MCRSKPALEPRDMVHHYSKHNLGPRSSRTRHTSPSGSCYDCFRGIGGLLPLLRTEVKTPARRELQGPACGVWAAWRLQVSTLYLPLKAWRKNILGTTKKTSHLLKTCFCHCERRGHRWIKADRWWFCSFSSKKEAKYCTRLHCMLQLFRRETQSVFWTLKAASCYPPYPAHMWPQRWMWTGDGNC